MLNRIVVRAQGNEAYQARRGNISPAVNRIAHEHGLGIFERDAWSSIGFQHGKVSWITDTDRFVVETNPCSSRR